MDKQIRVGAIRVRQNNHTIFFFAVDGSDLESFTKISHAHRDWTGDFGIDGYQRQEVMSHIAEIGRYLSTETAMLPNAPVVSFNSQRPPPPVLIVHRFRSPPTRPKQGGMCENCSHRHIKPGHPLYEVLQAVIGDDDCTTPHACHMEPEAFCAGHTIQLKLRTKSSC
jgi:hypothetical protein